MSKIRITSRILIYLPAYNCKKIAADTLRRIPSAFRGHAEALLVDNASPDGTAEVVKMSLQENPLEIPYQIIRTKRNLGYAGSQKLAYQIALENSSVDYVLMLHADGQYPPELATRFLEQCGGDADIVYGYRSKLRFGLKEETPIFAFIAIRVLSIVESILTLTFRKEWHTGYVMYRTSFLRRVPFQLITNTPHIDGHLLYAGKKLGANVRGIPIYKRYKNLVHFTGFERMKYVLTVLRLMFTLQSIKLNDIKPEKNFSDKDFDLIWTR
jgi:glycosyltransferase involved in cell wall biosynthesis